MLITPRSSPLPLGFSFNSPSPRTTRKGETYHQPMWRNDSGLTAPAIVISSLGGVVYGKENLTRKDACRARMLRQALKAQLGRPSGPRPRGQSCTEHELSDEVLRHRVLPTERENSDTNNTGGFYAPAEYENDGVKDSSSSNARALVSSRTPSKKSTEARPSRKHGWKIQGQIAGEWRDKLGRHRRAIPEGIGNETGKSAPGYAPAADFSLASSIHGSSCAGTDVSFEGLVDELRGRLPRPSHFADSPAGQRQYGHHACAGLETMAMAAVTTGDWQQKETNKNQREDGGGGSDGIGRTLLGPGGEGAIQPRQGEICRNRSNEERHEEEAAAAGLMPTGCLRLRHPLIGAMRRTNSQHLVRSTTSGGTSKTHTHLSCSARNGLQPSLVLPPEGLFFSDGSAYRLTPTEAIGNHYASPSAAMVAAAKAHERALPLLQVCAHKLTEPTGVSRGQRRVVLSLA